MFFLDNEGFFALVCVFLQCVIAWVFVAFFGGLAPRQTPWVRRWLVGFVGLGVALTAISWRFLLAHRHMGDVDLVREGVPLTRLLYGTYLAGKFVFLWYLVGGVAALRGGLWPCLRARTKIACGVVCMLLGAALPTIEMILVVQAPAVILAFGYSAWLLRSRVGERRETGRGVVAVLLWAWSLMWLVYATCTIMLGVLHPVSGTIWYVPLRLNSFIDMTLQIVLATGLVVLILQHAQNTALRAIEERNRFREQVERGEKVRVMSTLVSGVAHEINNPLTAILGYAEDLATDDPEVRRHAARVVTEQAERCRGIVQRLSILGRQAPSVCEAVDVESLVARVAAGFRPQFAQAGIALELRLSPVGATVDADPTGLEQVLTNLIANALQASAVGAAVVVSTIVEGDQVRFQVDDQGPGVLPADRPRVFEPFWTTKEAGQGTGLGLAVAKALVDSHGGSIEVGDSLAGGARFVVIVPRSSSIAPAKPVATAPVVDKLPFRSVLRLLCIDDEPLVRSTIVRRARNDGWIAVEESSAEGALERLLEHGEHFDAIVCDLRMPGISGIGFYDCLLAREPHLLRRVVFVTGDLVSPDAAAFAVRCRAPIVTKPFVVQDLMERLADVAASEAESGPLG
jgi:signal transduction histidine kinase